MAVTRIRGNTQIAATSIVNGQIAADAAIALSKLAVDVLARANHTGTQSADTLTDGSTNVAFLATERTKLDGVATGATANATDADLRDRTTHTGAQAISTVTGLQTALDAKQASSAKGAANGYASLDGDGLVPVSQLPAISITDTFVVANEAAQLALTAEVGDVAIRTDEAKTYILRAAGASTLANWELLQTPAAAVSSVLGRVGAVVATSGDYNAGQVTVTPAGNLGSTTVQAALVELQGDINGLTSGSLTAASFVDSETPTGSVDGTNDVFVLANVPTSGSEHVYLNGIRMERGSGNYYTISTDTITFLFVPLSGDKIRVDYRK